MTRDTWGGDYTRPVSLNRWMYTLDNPVNYTDPRGHYPWPSIGSVVVHKQVFIDNGRIITALGLHPSTVAAGIAAKARFGTIGDRIQLAFDRNDCDTGVGTSAPNPKDAYISKLKRLLPEEAVEIIEECYPAEAEFDVYDLFD